MILSKRGNTFNFTFLPSHIVCQQKDGCLQKLVQNMGSVEAESQIRFGKESALVHCWGRHAISLTLTLFQLSSTPMGFVWGSTKGAGAKDPTKIEGHNALPPLSQNHRLF